ncbi:Na/Pi symporter [Halalkalibacter flavus]|uniref:Na/Pi symporter n=1 Tax=Halalkalibacter flavus TaxID=3090668 RepID=UPI002FC972E0
MGNLPAFIDFHNFSGDQWWWTIVLVIVGIILTVVLQSSSAAVVTTLTALHTGAIDFHQAAILVIGQNVGTTVKAFLAAMGGTIAAKRTATAHILFNLITGIVALLFLHWLLQIVSLITEELHITDLAVALAIFHTLFNMIGVVVVLSILPWFKILIKRIVPDQDENYHQFLDPTVASVGPIGIEASRRAMIQILSSISVKAQNLLLEKNAVDFNKEEKGLQEVQEFLTAIANPNTHQQYEEHVGMIHSLDHGERLIRALKESEDYMDAVKTDQRVNELVGQLADIFEETIDNIEKNNWDHLLEVTEHHSFAIAELRKQDR